MKVCWKIAASKEDPQYAHSLMERPINYNVRTHGEDPYIWAEIWPDLSHAGLTCIPLAGGVYAVDCAVGSSRTS